MKSKKNILFDRIDFKNKLLIKMIIVFSMFSCSIKNQNYFLQIVKDYYSIEATRDGGGYTDLKEANVLEFNDNNKDTILATIRIEGIYNFNAVPNAPPPEKYIDTLYWKFYLKKNKWVGTYNKSKW